jgi:hypothetical protein
MRQSGGLTNSPGSCPVGSRHVRVPLQWRLSSLSAPVVKLCLQHKYLRLASVHPESLPLKHSFHSRTSTFSRSVRPSPVFLRALQSIRDANDAQRSPEPLRLCRPNTLVRVGSVGTNVSASCRRFDTESVAVSTIRARTNLDDSVSSSDTIVQ